MVLEFGNFHVACRFSSIQYFEQLVVDRHDTLSLCNDIGFKICPFSSFFLRSLEDVTNYIVWWVDV